MLDHEAHRALRVIRVPKEKRVTKGHRVIRVPEEYPVLRVPPDNMEHKVLRVQKVLRV